ncbi:MAG: hypothetical protein J5843_02675, partial [Clostridia bacterium]|nr:hypothetical protein [Clostridia bacterium]
TVVGEDFGLYSAEEVIAELDRRQAAGDLDEDERKDILKAFEAVIEFTDDGQVLEWARLPEGIGQEEIDEALKAGEIQAVKDGFFCLNSRPWKYVKGAYYYDTGSTRELFGEQLSSWDELKPDEEGCIPYASGMMLLKRI